ncbi:RNA 2',3'-cyclic phosphodiesterase [Oxalobacter aliiformigenes]|uniref:RNA 2',3'-cyclic phosphodiesterase n=1 Tax=Oxalobacter aliiformigenes TaxID=2946593 RepID=A0ABY7JK60_9BURK|nr:RNA 2',3'-cyclic phosphodiesterase [Oxalobacter aliiformigenes]WAV92952.1 RNA 2',3'-cyclic phosphodiesterase [Oxalobacter aliiformigenes]WAV95545.1 RNA 2',3'-cyclic phosphodiesterase [Oxalobacter aliiformigenes]WAV96659.1 RNA 2',3'-cyclic phosphodiesterase [Oxalobacter aliiformigenes]
MTDSPIPKKRQKTKRLFLALLPDQTVVEQLARLQKDIPGRKTPRENLHLTLAFLGNQPVSAISGLTDFLDHTEFAPFRLSLDKTGYFPKIRLSWIGPTRIPEALDKLHETTRQFLIPAYIENKKETFRPHITLARQSVLPDIKIDAPIIWQVNRFALMQSVLNPEPGGYPGYHILHEIAASVPH